MASKVRKAVFPAAGLGTRFLPATKASPKTGEQMDELRDEMEALASQFGGEYDGWEAAIDSLGSGDVEHGRKVN